MTKNKRIFIVIIAIASLFVFQQCKTYYFRKNYKTANKLLHDTNNLKQKLFLKAHLKNGDVCIIRDTWQFDTINNTLNGNGDRYDFNRNLISQGKISIPFDSIAIYETNKKLKNTETVRGLVTGILVVADAAIGIACLSNPKACFGSCPTFYLDKDDDFHHANAEGFSKAISPSLEYSDVDALNNPEVTSQKFKLTMKNEALETHCVKDVKLLAVPRNAGERVYHTRHNQYFVCHNSYPLKSAKVDNQDVSSLLRLQDREEYFSLADANNLNSKETIYVDFDLPDNQEQLGLIVNFRQTLMTTYLIYSAMGYMGDEVSDVFAKIENSRNIYNKLDKGIYQELGDINIYTWDETQQSWQFEGGLYEIGPIAINHQFLPLKAKTKNRHLKMKIVLNKGYWRLDYLALTNINKEVKPVELKVQSVVKNGQMDVSSLKSLNNPKDYLVSVPGDVFDLQFNLPKPHQDYELFLYSKGYYLEWMRESWLKDKNMKKLRQMLINPKKYLKEEAGAYKIYEATMEDAFWNSKVKSKNNFCNEK